MQSLLSLWRWLKPQRDERWAVAVAAAVMTLLASLPILRYHHAVQALKRTDARAFVKLFHLSGYDPLTYGVVDSWSAAYNVYRHPLLAFFMYPLHLICRGVDTITGGHSAQWVVAALLVAVGTLSFLLLQRILRHVLHVQRTDALLLCALYFGCAHIMVASMAPDHFALSQMLLLLTTCLSGLALQRGQSLKWWQEVGLFVATAGVTLSNGLKVFLSSLFTRGIRFFKPAHLIGVILLPAFLLWIGARWEYALLVYPAEHQRHIQKAKWQKRQNAKTYAQMLKKAQQAGVKDSVQQRAMADSLMAQKKRVDKKREQARSGWARQGRPMGKGEFMRWTDVSTPRLKALWHNIFGEGIQLHRQHLLQDQYTGARPTVVDYTFWGNYVVEVLLILLALIGLWYGRHSRFLWMIMGWVAIDAALHLGLGFGLNEPYIMSAHWMFILPLSISFLLHKKQRQSHLLIYRVVRSVIALLTLWLWLWNFPLILQWVQQ